MFGAWLLVSGVGKIIIGKGVGTEVDGGEDWIMSSRVGVGTEVVVVWIWIVGCVVSCRT